MESLREFWNLIVDVWTKGAYGFDVGSMLETLLVLLVFVMLRRLFSRTVVVGAKRLAHRTHSPIDDEVIEALEKPIEFIPIVMGIFFAAEYIELEDDLAVFVGNLLRSLVAFNLFWALYAIVDPIASVFRKLEAIFTREMVSWLVRSVKVLFVLIGGAAILEVWGIRVGPLLAGLGLFGVAVALGAQDLFKNLIAGVLILAEKRFRIGDWILVDGIVEGNVEHIGFRSTMVRRFDKALVQVPNTELSDHAVTNFTEMLARRIYWKIGVEYRTTAAQLREIRDGIEKYITDSDEFAHQPEFPVPTFVRIDGFNDSSIDIMVYCFTKTIVWGEWLEIRERLAYRIKEIVEGAGTGFAFPSQSLYVESWPALGPPDAFTPPGDVEAAALPESD